jgi:RimJ/RimL family protein N-acetyltransferase
MSLIQIDFDFSPHKEIIMKLCNRNKFYEDDISVIVNRDLPTNYKNYLIKIVGVEKYENHNKNLFTGLKHFGYFIIVEENLKKKVIGFIIYHIKEKFRGSELLFILIDKKYQNNGYGTMLLNKYIQDINEKKIMISIVKIENKEMCNFYKKTGFKYLATDDKYDVLCYVRS